MKVSQHYPTFFEGFPVVEAEVGTLLELVGLDFIAAWPLKPGFYRFSLERNAAPDYHLLLAEFEEGRKWYVVARLEGEDLYPFRVLPPFDPPTKESNPSK
jgi:hypothetical protein